MSNYRDFSFSEGKRENVMFKMHLNRGRKRERLTVGKIFNPGFCTSAKDIVYGRM